MRELHLTITCDKCKAEIEEGEAVLVVVSTPEEGDFEADMCRPCYVEVVSRFRPAPPKKRKSPSLGVQAECPHCDRKFGSQRGLTKHIQSAHSKPVHQATCLALNGDPCDCGAGGA